ncbi:ATP/GTP-binding protein (plasmid) [Streptomyces viridosporus]
MSDDTDSNVISLPTRGSDSGGMPDAPDGGELFYSEPPDSGSDRVVPPEPPAETTMELPPIRGPISPETALRETGMPAAPDSGDGEYEEDEYVQPRSLADRLGDWLELRIEMARERHASEAPFREAEIARKAALLEARTAQETAMMEQNAKLHTAQMKAKADKAAARGKADAARSSSSGLGADKGGRSKAGGGGGSRGGGGNSGGSGRGGGRGSGTSGSGGTGRSSGGGNSPKGSGKGSDRSTGGRGGGSKGRQNGSGGSGKSGTGKGSSGGSGKSGAGNSGSGKGGSKGDGGRTQNSPASSPRAERARGRQERAAARQAARQQRRSANQAANLADRSKNRDQDRANRQAEREEHRAAKAERKAARKAARKAKREAAKAAEDRTTLGAAAAEEAQRRWDKRRAAEKDRAAKANKAKDPSGDKDSEATTKKMPKDGPETAADGPKDDSATKEPDDGKKSGEKPSDGSGDTDPKDGAGTDDVKDPPGTDDNDDGRSFKEKLKDYFFTKAGEGTTPPEPEEPSTLRPEDLGVTVDRPGGPTRSAKTEAAEEDIPDAVIVDDPADPFGATVTSPASLPRAPEPHTQRPGTTRPTAQEDPVASEVSRPTSGQTGMAAKHRTDITFGEYLMEIVNIAIAAALDKDRAQDLAVALGKVADALRDMATDLIGDHNIATEVVDQITDLADAADRMKQLAERCATECEIASEAARIAAMSVGRVYGEDIQAMDDAGLAHASAAAHHD